MLGGIASRKAVGHRQKLSPRRSLPCIRRGSLRSRYPVRQSYEVLQWQLRAVSSDEGGDARPNGGRGRQRAGLEEAEADLGQAEIDCNIGNQVDLDVRQPRMVIAQLGANLNQRLGTVGRNAHGLFYDRVWHRSHDG